jgi:aminoglycoside phosphotransferase (APT) family kinase protein
VSFNTRRIDHEDIDVSLVSRLVARQFPQWAHLSVRPVQPSGWDNRTFRLGDEMVVRLPSAEGYVAQVEKEHRWLPRLAPHLPLAIPIPLAMGLPDHEYPWAWSVYHWIDGERASVERIGDLRAFANDLARFITALQQVDPTDVPVPKPHNFLRGGPLPTYDREMRQAIAGLDGRIDTGAATEVWDAALATIWRDSPVWVHGDLTTGNMLVQQGRLRAVIDFGCSGVGDPACDLVIAWTLLSGESRNAFRTTLTADGATWARGRGWALWKALATLVDHKDTDPVQAEGARRVINEILSDYRQVNEHSGQT